MSLDHDTLVRVRDAILSSERGTTSTEFARGVHAMASAVFGLLQGPAAIDALRHPHEGLRVRLKGRPQDLVVDKVVVHAEHGTSVYCHSLPHKNAPTRWKERRHRMKLATWRQWTRGARVLEITP